jgi:hypothetical protein
MPVSLVQIAARAVVARAVVAGAVVALGVASAPAALPDVTDLTLRAADHDPGLR